MTDPDRDPQHAGRRVRGPVGRRLAGRRRLVFGAGGVLVALIAAAAMLAGRVGSPSIAGSPPLPSTFRPGLGIGPVSLGESRAAVLAVLGGSPAKSVAGTLVFDRPGGALAVGFVGGRAARVLATGGRNPFGQRLAAEETSLSSWMVEICAKPAHLLLVAPGGRTYFVFSTAAAGLGAVGVSTAQVTRCGPLA